MTTVPSLPAQSDNHAFEHGFSRISDSFENVIKALIKLKKPADLGSGLGYGGRKWSNTASPTKT